MKILAIRLENIASLAGNHTLDLAHAPLEDTGLFAITGPTGAGKSTLLDALCLALYGNTPRLRRAPGRDSTAPDIEGESLITADPRTLLHRGATSGAAEVDFIGRDGQHYRACWRVRRARSRADGKLQSIEQSLMSLPDRQVITAHKREFDRLLPQRLGLSFDQFTRAVLLAQSEFGTFLKASDNERSELLEKLTDTDIYSRVSVAAWQRTRAAGEQVQSLETQLGERTPASPELRQTLEHNARQAQQALTALQHREALLKRRRDWLITDHRLDDSWQAACRSHEQAEQAQRALSEDRQLAARLDAFAPQRYQFEQRDSARLALIRTREALSHTQQSCHTVDQQLAQHQYHFEQAEAVAGQAEQTRRQCQPQLDDGAAREQRRHYLDGEINRYRQRLETLGDDHRQQRAALADHLAQRTARQQELKALDQRLQLIHDSDRYASLGEWRQAMQHQQDQAHQRLHALEALRHRFRHWQELTSRYDELTRIHQQEQTSLEQLTAAGRQARQAFDRAEANHLRLSQSITRLRAARSDSVEQLRAQLEHATPCPVCGGLEHPYRDQPPPTPARALIEQTEQEEQRQLDEAVETLETARERCHQLRGRYTTLKSQLEQRSETLTALGRQLDEAEQNVTACPPSEALLAVPEHDREHWLSAELEAATCQRDECARSVARLDHDQQAREPLLAALQQLDVDIGRLESETHHQQQQLDELHATLAPAQREYDTLNRQLAQQLGAHPSVAHWREALDQDLQKTQQQLTTARRERDACREQHHTLTQRLEHLGDNEARQREALEALESAIHCWRNEHPDIDDELLDTLLHTDVQTHHALNQRLQQADQYVHDAHLLAQERHDALITHRHRWPRVATDQPELADTDIDSDEDFHARRTELEAALDEKERILAEQLTSAQQARDEAEHALRDDDHCRARARDIQQALDGARRTRERWGRISGLIGAADGKAFRRIAQAWNLERLIDHANVHLKSLARRYRLERGGSELGLLVIDTEMGDERRSVHSLSGGETFLVSLALALALASMASGELAIDTLFIDEGFGSLDPASLAQVMDALDGLQAQGRQVGIISHVQEMHERIPAQVRVTPRGNGTSTITCGRF